VLLSSREYAKSFEGVGGSDTVDMGERLLALIPAAP
jgi:hypothetical protein